MKNIHIIPTDKPSRLGYLTKKGKQVFNDLRLFDRVMPNILDSENQHLYITNDEEIIEGDLIIYKNGDEYFFAEYRLGYYDRYELCKKIILTTDQDLIKDHVQAIDDEFLEWFVNNPSCEEVEVREIEVEDYVGFAGHTSYPTFHKEYKIIIPKKEPKQLNLEYFGLPKIGTKEFNNLASGLFGGKPKQEKLTYTESAKKEERISNSIMMKRKQETVEDAAENNWDKINSEYKNGLNPYAHKIGFIEGAEWMQERMYSEEEVNDLLEMLKRSISEINHLKYTYKDKGHCGKYLSDCETIIEQFKKK